jgi:hypothetical protein
MNSRQVGPEKGSGAERGARLYRSGKCLESNPRRSIPRGNAATRVFAAALEALNAARRASRGQLRVYGGARSPLEPKLRSLIDPSHPQYAGASLDIDAI